VKVLITGAGAMLARELVPRLLASNYDVLALPHDKLDETDLGAIRSTVDSFEPHIIVNCAAYTKVDEAEKEENKALMVNGFGVQNLCLVCQEYDITLVHFSTDYVFDGTKEEPYTIYDDPNPLNVFGRSKLLGEKYILWLLSKFYLIRTSWVFGQYGDNMIETMLELGRGRSRIPVVSDQRGSPTWARHLAEAVVALMKTGRYGIYHITNSGSASWIEFVQELYQLSSMDVELVSILSDELPMPARRPLNSVLDPFPFPQLLEREMPSWKTALKEYLKLNSEAEDLKMEE